MKCPHCRQEIEPGQEWCPSCGTKIKRTFFQCLADHLRGPKVSEEEFAEGLARGNVPKLANPEELRLYLKHTVHDEKFAEVLLEILGTIGRAGCVETRQGGEGSPYSVEYQYPELPGHMSRREAAKRAEQVARLLAKENSPVERQRLQDELAQLAGARAIIWVNSSSQSDVDRAGLMLDQGMRAIEQALRQKKQG